MKFHSFIVLSAFIAGFISGCIFSFFTYPYLLVSVEPSRESEAKSMLGAINRAQQGYFTENYQFASSFEALEVPTTPKGYTYKYYTFEILPEGLIIARGVNNRKNKTRDYIGGISYNEEAREFGSVVCRASEARKPDYKISNPKKAILDYGLVNGQKSINCGQDVDTLR